MKIKWDMLPHRVMGLSRRTYWKLFGEPCMFNTEKHPCKGRMEIIKRTFTGMNMKETILECDTCGKCYARWGLW
jgi:hypothetical protein